MSLRHQQINAPLEATGSRRDGTIQLAIATYGLRIGVDIAAPELVEEALLRLPPAWEPIDWCNLDRSVRLGATNDPGSDRRYLMRIDEEPESAPMGNETALDAFENALQYYVAEFATPWLFVHAGVVAWRGRAIIIPGRSHSGKSTLTKALVDAGATYLSDEYAVIGPDGLVRPYARRLSLRDGPLGPAGRVDLDGHAPSPGAALPIGLVAALRFDEETVWDVEQITRAQGIMAMCDNTVAIQRRPKHTLDYLGQALARADAIRGTRGDARAAVDRLLRMASSV